MLEIVLWAALVLSGIGIYLNARQRISCWYFWLVADLIWAVIELVKGRYPEAAAFLVFFISCFYGLHQWRKNDI